MLVIMIIMKMMIVIMINYNGKEMFSEHLTFCNEKKRKEKAHIMRF